MLYIVYNTWNINNLDFVRYGPAAGDSSFGSGQKSQPVELGFLLPVTKRGVGVERLRVEHTGRVFFFFDKLTFQVFYLSEVLPPDNKTSFVFYRSTMDAHDLTFVSAQINERRRQLHFSAATNSTSSNRTFKATHVFVATWVAAKNIWRMDSTFQLVLAVDSPPLATYLLYNYGKCWWWAQAVAVPLDQNGTYLSLSRLFTGAESNVDRPGQFIFSLFHRGIQKLKLNLKKKWVKQT